MVAEKLESKTETRTEPGRIHELMVKAMQDMPHIGKERTAEAGKYSYQFRGIDDVYNYVGPVLARHGIVLLSEVLKHEVSERVDKATGRVTMFVTDLVRWAFTASDGSQCFAEFPGVGMDTSDKAANKAMSVSLREACIKTFMIPIAGSVDPEQDDIPLGQKVTKPESNGNGHTQSPARVQHDADGKLSGVYEIESVREKRRGTGKNGKPYVIWQIITQDGCSFDTFSNEAKALCERSIGRKLSLTFTSNEKFGNSLVAAEEAEPGEESQDAPDAPDAPDAEPPPAEAPTPEGMKFDVIIKGVSARIVETAKGGRVTVYDIATNQTGLTFVTGKDGLAADLKKHGESSKHGVSLFCHEVNGGKWHVDQWDEIPF